MLADNDATFRVHNPKVVKLTVLGERQALEAPTLARRGKCCLRRQSRATAATRP